MWNASEGILTRGDNGGMREARRGKREQKRALWFEGVGERAVKEVNRASDEKDM